MLRRWTSGHGCVLRVASIPVIIAGTRVQRHFDILSLHMAKWGETIGWRALLGADRKNIGDFACYLHRLLGVKAG